MFLNLISRCQIMDIDLVLFDLDGTLAVPTIGTRILSLVVEGYAEYVSERTGKDKNIVERAVIRSLKELRVGVPGNKTIDWVFLERIASKIDFDPKDLYSVTEDFYAEYFPRYRDYYEPAPNARKTLLELRKMGLKVGIATDPIVFMEGVKQRLNWVNIDDIDYCVVTAAQNSHYVKPHLEYYEETISKCKSTPEKTLMVGNTYEFDIRPMLKLGGKALYISFEPNDIMGGELRIGDLMDIIDYLRKN